MDEHLIYGYRMSSFVFFCNISETRNVARWRMLVFAEDPFALATLLFEELAQRHPLLGKQSRHPWGKTRISNSTLWYPTQEAAEAARSRHYPNQRVCIAAPIPLKVRKNLRQERHSLKISGTPLPDPAHAAALILGLPPPGSRKT